MQKDLIKFGATHGCRCWHFSSMPLVMVLYRDISDYISGKTHIMNSVLGLVLTALGIPLFTGILKRDRQKASIKTDAINWPN